MSSLAILYSRAQVGIQAIPVTIEVHLTNGLPKLLIVGLPETAVKESQERVRSALMNAQFEFPLQRITINLAPADLPKEGGRFDLAIALGILAASRQIPSNELFKYEFIGELALNGDLRPVRGVLPMALEARNAQRQAVVPFENAAEANMVSGVPILAVKHLLDICAHLQGTTLISPYTASEDSEQIASSTIHVADLSDVRGQHHAKRALEVAAAGGHNLLMLGPPGTGKTMLASRMPGILPSMTENEALETATVASIAVGGFNPLVWAIRPFRAPHHTASGVALVGGGSHPRPGEVSLAHNGILFLDELPEFEKRVLEVLREPMESGHITISRAAHQAEFPANFQLIAAMNPCPCGYLGDVGRCRCSPQQVSRYRSKISGPLLDRIDLHIEVPNLPRSELRQDVVGETSLQVRTRVVAAREIQVQRSGKANSLLDNRDIDKFCRLQENDERLLDTAIEQLGLSARAWYRILKVSRTIADLANSENIQTAHLTEAITYRRLEKRKL